jgi:nitrogen regulatory protein PII
MNLNILGLDVLDEVNHTGGVAELVVVPEINHFHCISTNFDYTERYLKINLIKKMNLNRAMEEHKLNKIISQILTKRSTSQIGGSAGCRPQHQRQTRQWIQ